jgi:flavin prenyltransferase
VVRETPLHAGHLKQLLKLAQMGGIVMPPLPAFYQRPKTLQDIVDHTVGRVLERLGLPQDLVPEWQGTR